MASREMLADKRRLEAIDQLWSSATALEPAKMLCAMMSIINFETAAKRAERDPNFRKTIEALGGGFDLKLLDLSGAAKARPFLSPMAWATYAALSALVWFLVIRWHVLKSGLRDFQSVADDEPINKVIKAALPEHADFVDKHGPSGYYLLMNLLETKLLQELQANLAGAEADKASIEQAAEIVRQSDEVLKRRLASELK